MKKYYQVFISSASKEFKDIRPRLINEIIKQDRYFPVAMEFMAANSHTFEMLYNYMKSSDVCVLLLGDNNGSQIGSATANITNPDMLKALHKYMEITNLSDMGEITYTEFEYAVARHLKIEVLPFIKKSLVSRIEAGKAPSEDVRFYNAVRAKSAYVQWEEELPLSDVITAINHHVDTSTSVTGWIRETDSAIYQSTTNAGIVDVSLQGSFTDDKFQSWLDNATDVKLFYTTGLAMIYSKSTMLGEFIAKGGNVKLLCSKPNSDVLLDIQHVEEPFYGNRDAIHQEFQNVFTRCQNIMHNAHKLHKENGYTNPVGSLMIGLASTLFRASILVCENRETGINNGWLTITLPPAKSIETVSFEIFSNPDNCKSNNLLNRATAHFDSVWSYAAERGEIYEIEKTDQIPEFEVEKSVPSNNSYWLEKESVAVSNMKKRKRYPRVLIEIAAQHPLEDGMYPAKEFAIRLDTAVDLYHQLTEKGTEVELYVPGSVHLDDDGVADEVSLSEAGCQYLIEKGIPADKLHGDDLNNRYDNDRSHTGVYNSADECFVSSKYFFSEEKQFGKLYSICSPNQLMRKTLFYIQFGIIPNVITVPTDKMYHNFLHELFTSVPYVLSEDHDYQYKDSKEAIRTRSERMPDYKE